MFKISVCMIVKNEEKYIKQCLDSINDIAYEIIIVDTGSEDNTISIVKKYSKVKLYHHLWENNFSLHRNQSISYATGDWLLFIDADEELFGDKKQLSSFLDKLDKRVTCVQYMMHDIHSNKIVMQCLSSKIFKRGHIKFEKIVHNQPITDGYFEICDFIYFNHYGYDVTPEIKKQKIERTMGLLKKRIEDNSEDYEAYFYMAQMCGWEEDWKNALKYCMIYIANREKIKPFNHAIYFSAARICLSKLPNKIHEAKEILDMAPRKDLDILLALSEYYAINQNSNKLKETAFQFLEAYKQFKGEPHFIHCYTPEAYFYCSTNYIMCILREGVISLLPEFQEMTLKCISGNLNSLLKFK